MPNLSRHSRGARTNLSRIPARTKTHRPSHPRPRRFDRKPCDLLIALARLTGNTDSPMNATIRTPDADAALRSDQWPPHTRLRDAADAAEPHGIGVRHVAQSACFPAVNDNREGLRDGNFREKRRRTVFSRQRDRVAAGITHGDSDPLFGRGTRQSERRRDDVLRALKGQSVVALHRLINSKRSNR